MQLADDTSVQAVTVSSISERKEEFKIHIELNSSLRNLLRKLNQRESLPLVQIDGLEADLRPYQAEGVSWLLFLRGIGLGGCLADDMGLGKTVQFIAYLLAVKAAASNVEQSTQALNQTATATATATATELHPIGNTVPSLLICPTSVLGNWQKRLSVSHHLSRCISITERSAQRVMNSKLLWLAQTLS